MLSSSKENQVSLFVAVNLLGEVMTTKTHRDEYPLRIEMYSNTFNFLE